MTAVNRRSLFIPKGFAHGFLTLLDDSEVLYMISVPYAPGFERGVRWNDPALAIDWPIEPAVISARDAAYPLLDASTADSTAAKRVLVTGAGGFIGRCSLEPLCAAGYEVHAVLSKKAGAGEEVRPPDAQVHHADLLDARRDRCAHRGGPSDPSAAFRLDCDARTVLEQRGESSLARREPPFAAVLSAPAAGVRAVMAGSCAEYDWSRVQVCNERTQPACERLRPTHAGLYRVQACHAANARRRRAHAGSVDGVGPHFLSVRPARAPGDDWWPP